MKPLTPEHRAAIAAALRGKPKSPEHRARLSEAKKGQKPTPEARAAMSAAGRGKPKSPKHRAAISTALKGRYKTDVVTYHVMHSRLGNASEHTCLCGAPAHDWAYQHTAEEPLYSPEGWPYSTDPADYLPMCRSCHKLLDRGTTTCREGV